MKHARLRILSVELSCPHCYSTQPASGGSKLWVIAEAAKFLGTEPQRCFSCGGPYLVKIPRTIARLSSEQAKAERRRT